MANPSFKQYRELLIQSGGAIALAYVSNNAAGNLLFVEASWPGSTITASIADSQNNSWTALPQINGNLSSQGFYCLNSKLGANTVTITFSALTSLESLAISEYVPGNGSPLVADAHAEQNGTAGVVASSPAITTAIANELLIGYGSDGFTTWSAGSGWTLRSDPTGAGFQSQIFEDQISGAPGSYNMTSGNTLANSWAAGIAAFKQTPSSGGGGGGVGSLGLGISLGPMSKWEMF